MQASLACSGAQVSCISFAHPRPDALLQLSRATPDHQARSLAAGSLRCSLGGAAEGFLGHTPRRWQVLGELQDRLAPFSSAVAYALIEEELGQPVGAVFESLSPEPVAAASLGQARRRTDADVAG